MQHDSMAHDPDGPMPDQPGVDGVQYADKTNFLYYITTAQELFMRVAVDPDTHDPADEPEFVAGGMMGENSYLRHSIVGKPFTLQLIGPTNGVWGRGPGEQGHVAYFQTDGGTKSPPVAAGGIARPATVSRVEV
jgi:hypothetical protein